MPKKTKTTLKTETKASKTETPKIETPKAEEIKVPTLEEFYSEFLKGREEIEKERAKKEEELRGYYEERKRLIDETIQKSKKHTERMKSIYDQILKAYEPIVEKLKREELPSPPEKVDTLRSLEPWKRALISFTVLVGNIMGAREGLPHLGVLGYLKMVEAIREDDKEKFLEGMEEYKLQLEKWKTELDKLEAIARTKVTQLQLLGEKEALDWQHELNRLELINTQLSDQISQVSAVLDKLYQLEQKYGEWSWKTAVEINKRAFEMQKFLMEYNLDLYRVMMDLNLKARRLQIEYAKAGDITRARQFNQVLNYLKYLEKRYEDITTELPFADEARKRELQAELNSLQSTIKELQRRINKSLGLETTPSATITPRKSPRSLSEGLSEELKELFR